MGIAGAIGQELVDVDVERSDVTLAGGRPREVSPVLIRILLKIAQLQRERLARRSEEKVIQPNVFSLRRLVQIIHRGQINRRPIVNLLVGKGQVIEEPRRWQAHEVLDRGVGIDIEKGLIATGGTGGRRPFRLAPIERGAVAIDQHQGVCLPSAGRVNQVGRERTDAIFLFAGHTVEVQSQRGGIPRR